MAFILLSGVTNPRVLVYTCINQYTRLYVCVLPACTYCIDYVRWPHCATRYYAGPAGVWCVLRKLYFRFLWCPSWVPPESPQYDSAVMYGVSGGPQLGPLMPRDASLSGQL